MLTGSCAPSRRSSDLPKAEIDDLSPIIILITLAKCRSRPVSRVLSRGKTRGGEHSSRARVAARLQRAVPGGADRASLSPHPLARAGAPLREASLFALAPGGVCRAAPVTGGAVRSYRTVSPLPRAPRGAVRRSALCCTFLRVTPTGRWPAPCPVVPGLSSAALADRRVRPDGSSEGNIARARRCGKRRCGRRRLASGGWPRGPVRPGVSSRAAAWDDRGGGSSWRGAGPRSRRRRALARAATPPRPARCRPPSAAAP
jgi:hypothetical protein